MAPRTSPLPILLTDAAGRVTAVNSSARALLGDVVGAECRRVVRATNACERCETDPIKPDEERNYETVRVGGVSTGLRCSVVGETRVIALPEAETELPAKTLLSPREREVLVLVARGLTTGRIAERLGLAVSTVRTHVEHVLEKLMVRSRPQAVARALSLGEIE